MAPMVPSLVNVGAKAVHFDNITDFHTPYQGWVPSGNDRGTLDIVWSSCITIVLCCWVAPHPNALSPRDRQRHALRDKLHLFMVGLLGPDILLAMAFGQFSSAKRSVKLFKEIAHLCDGVKWTHRHGFFADMGGIFLKTPDYPEGFPITAEQLHYLLKHDHVDFPDLEYMCIEERNSSDTLSNVGTAMSRLLTIAQVIWFSVMEIQRFRLGLPMTTLEVTTLSFCFMMIGSTVLWFPKPSPMKPRWIETKEKRLAEDIRAMARETTHPGLAVQWYRTPLDFVGTHRWHLGSHWDYEARFEDLVHLNIFSRPVRSRPWDRIPSDIILPGDTLLAPLLLCLPVGFVVILMLSWNSYFPTETERIFWRLSIGFQAAFTGYVTLYGSVEQLVWDWRVKHGCSRNWTPRARQQQQRLEEGQEDGAASLSHSPAPRGAPSHTAITPSTTHQDLATQPSPGPETRSASGAKVRRVRDRLWAWVISFRNTSVDGDPEMDMNLTLMVINTGLISIYIICRLIMYVEDFVSMRQQPVGVYLTIDRFLPFLVPAVA